jgi:hypothetical protein
MFFGDNVQETRQLFYTSWHKYRLGQPLLPLEKQLADVILAHPEYHDLFDKVDAHNEQAYFPELGQTNPFLHMGLHLAVREQVATNRPTGMQALFQQLLVKFQDSLAVEHQIMECLAECLWLAQRNGCEPNESDYINAVTQLTV